MNEKTLKEKLIDYADIDQDKFFLLTKASKHRTDNTINICPSEINQGKDFLYFDKDTDSLYKFKNIKNDIENKYESRKTNTGAFFYKVPINDFIKIEKSKKNNNTKKEKRKNTEDEKNETIKKEDIYTKESPSLKEEIKTIDVTKYISTLPVSKAYHIDNIIKLTSIVFNKEQSTKNITDHIDDIIISYIKIVNSINNI